MVKHRHRSLASQRKRREISQQKSKKQRDAKSEDRHERARQQHGLDSNAKIVFLKKGAHQDILTISDGAVVIIDAISGKLICSVAFHDTNKMDSNLFDQFNDSITTLYKHATARHSVKTNGAAKRIKTHGRAGTYGQMYAMGFRPGYESKIQAGMFYKVCLPG